MMGRHALLSSQRGNGRDAAVLRPILVFACVRRVLTVYTQQDTVRGHRLIVIGGPLWGDT